MGAVGVTGTGAANALASQADVIVGVGTRFADFTTGSWALFKNPDRRLISVNVQPFDAAKHQRFVRRRRRPDGARRARRQARRLEGAARLERRSRARPRPNGKTTAARYIAPTNAPAPTDAEVLGALMRAGEKSDVVVCASGGLPGELHKLWQAGAPLGYHLEYGYSCMGYEIAGGIGVKMALPDREVVVVLGDGSYLMMNSEIATSVMLGQKLIIVVNDNRGFGCINRLQQATGGAPFNNLLRDVRHEAMPEVDFVAHARALGAEAVKVKSIADLETAFKKARAAKSTQVIVIDTDPMGSTDAGGFWWDVAVPEVSERKEVDAARRDYEEAQDVAAGWRLSMSIRIGANPIGWTNDDLQEIGGDTPLETCLAEAKEAGVVGMEKGHKMPTDGAALKDKLAEFGLTFVGGWYSTELLKRSAREEFEAAKSHIAMTKGAGADIVIVAETSNCIHGDRSKPLSERPRLHKGDWAGYGAKMTEFAERLADEGLKLCYHHHMGTIVQSERDIDALMAHTKPPVHLLLDTGHARWGGADPAALARAYRSRIGHVHCKDVREATDARIERRRLELPRFDSWGKARSSASIPCRATA